MTGKESINNSINMCRFHYLFLSLLWSYMVDIIIPCYRWKNWGLEDINNLVKATLGWSGRAGIHNQLYSTHIVQAHNHQDLCTLPNHKTWKWFYWKFIPVTQEFLLSTINTWLCIFTFKTFCFSPLIGPPLSFLLLYLTLQKPTLISCLEMEEMD